VFVIAYNVDHMTETFSAALHEPMKAIATIFCSHDVMGVSIRNILGHKNVAAQNQHFGCVWIVKIQVAKFKMQV
jgi:hypothetical protein